MWTIWLVESVLATLDRNQVYHSVLFAAVVRHQSQCNIIVTLWTGIDVQVQYTVKWEIFDHQFLDHQILEFWTAVQQAKI